MGAEAGSRVARGSVGERRPPPGRPRAGRRWHRWVFYGVIPLVILGAVAFNLWQVVRTNPDRERAVTLAPVGQVLVNLRTIPYPALTTGTVVVEISLRGARGRPLEVDRVRLAYGKEDETTQTAVASPTEMLGLYRAQVRFPSVGTWWMDVTLELEGALAKTRFMIPVKPAL